jgi:putative transposase
VRFIAGHKGRAEGGLRWGVESICAVLSEQGCPIAPSTYYDAASRGPSARAVREEQLKAHIARVHAENYGVYGARKVWLQLNREGIAVARWTAPVILEALIPGRMQSHASTAEVRRGAARARGQDGA